MPNWKKVITSGSDAALRTLEVSNQFTANGTGSLNLSGSFVFTGSFIVTGSSQIIGPISVIGDQSINGNVTITGNITAQQYIVSSSVLYITQSFSSGSTVFGNSLDDTHRFTGSLFITGSVTNTVSITSPTFIGNLTGNADTATSATTATTATGITSPLTQDLTINGSFSNRISYTLFDRLITSYGTSGPGHGYSGEVFAYELGRGGFDIDLTCDRNSLLGYFDGGQWGYVEAWKNVSTGMLGFRVRDPDTNEEGILTEGYIVLDGTNITDPSIGAPLWFYQEDTGGGAPVDPPLPFRTSFYDGSSQFTLYQRMLGHLCYTDGSGLWILRFKPSNDWLRTIQN